MSSEESRRIVQFASTGKYGYKAALQSLEDAYGRPRLVYPHHFKAILANDNYTYDLKSLRRMRETWELHLRGLERCNGNTLEQFLATVVTEHFDKRMKHEWSTYAADFSDPPTIQDVLDLFRKKSSAWMMMILLSNLLPLTNKLRNQIHHHLLLCRRVVQSTKLALTCLNVRFVDMRDNQQPTATRSSVVTRKVTLAMSTHLKFLFSPQ